MASLEGGTLGEKHKHYNKLVEEAVAKNIPQSTDQTLGEDDIANLLKIDVACKAKNLEFVLNILKSEDSLYVSRAIKNSKWLITEKEYAHIVNPEYLFTQLAPDMTSKAFNKLMLSIRLNLKDEKRVEGFYKYIGERNQQDSFKWLQNCSVPFIETELKKHDEDIPSDYLRRLAEKSISIFEVFMKSNSYRRYKLMQDSVFLAKINTEKYMDIIETMNRLDITYGPKTTTIFMKRYPDRILDKFEFYAEHIHMPTFAKYLKAKQDIKTFLLKQVENDKLKWFFTYKYMEHFIKHMSKENKFEFVRKVFIDKEFSHTTDKGESYEDDCVGLCSAVAYKCGGTEQDNKAYQWYKFAPFDEAFPDLKKLIRSESSPVTRNLILQVLLSCAGKNMNNVRAVLKYYREKHINEPFKFKNQFVNMFLSKTDSHEFDNETWGLLNQLFQSMEVYVESDNNTISCVKVILIRHLIRGEDVPEIIKEKFTFETLKEYQSKLKKEEDKLAVFNYLNDYLVAKHDAQKISTQSELGEAIALCESHLNLWNDWKKELKNFTFLIKRVKNLLTTKQENSWNTDMNVLYNFNTAWKKVLFNESISLCPSEAVCVNALKHDPKLLTLNKNEVEAILKNDGIFLRDLLHKIRIYWSDSLAEEWKTSYLSRLEKPGGHKALVTGLCALLPEKQLNELAQKYAPSESKIDWDEVDELTISLQKQLAKHLSKARPLIHLETVLSYAKGDYLQFAVPSLNSVLSQLSVNKIRKYLPKLLDSPVSLQKFGVRYAFSKLKSQELKPIFTDIWKTTKNLSIRTVLFTHTHAALCKEKNQAQIKEIWELLSMFIDNLSMEENKEIYEKMGDVSRVPISVRPLYFMKSYTFLHSLPAKANCESILDNMRCESPKVMEWLDDDFVVNIMLKKIDEKFTKNDYNSYDNGKIVAAFMLSCKNEAAATSRYEKFLAPLLDRNLPLWNHVHEKRYYVKSNVKEILMKLIFYIDEYNLSKKMNIPVKCFQNILSKLQAALSPKKEYVFLTTWKIAVIFIQSVNENKDLLNKLNEEINENDSDEDKKKKNSELHTTVAPFFAKSCIELLKSDIEQFQSSIHIMFAKAFKEFFETILSQYFARNIDFYEYMIQILKSSDDKEVYLVAYQVLKKYVYYLYDETDREKMKGVRKILYRHPSEELRMFYYQLFNDTPDSDIEK